MLFPRFSSALIAVFLAANACSRTPEPAPTPNSPPPTRTNTTANDAGTSATRDASSDVPPTPGPTGTIEGVVFLEGPLPQRPALTVPPGWRNRPACAEAAVRYAQSFDITSPGPFPGALVAAEARSSVPSPEREFRLVFRDCDLQPRMLFATMRDRVIFEAHPRIAHLVHVGGDGSVIDRVLFPTTTDQRRFPSPGNYPVHPRDLPEWVGSMVYILPNQFIDTTDLQGHFRITGIPVGEIPVNAWYPNARPARQVATVRAGETTRLEFHLHPIPARAPAPTVDAGIPVPQ